AHARPSGAAVRRVVPGLVAAHRIRGRQPGGEEVKKPYADPYLAGVALGLVLRASFVFAGRGLGASGAFTRGAADAMAALAPQRAAASPLFARYADGDHWLLLELAGVVIGGFLSALLAGRLELAVERGPRMAR